MRNFWRLAVGLIGLGSIATMLALWWRPAVMAGTIGLEALGPVGLATVRADIAGLFATIGGLMLVAAWRGSAHLAHIAMVPVAAALTGRIINAVDMGLAPGTLGPIGVECVTLIILFAAARHWRARNPA